MSNHTWRRATRITGAAVVVAGAVIAFVGLFYLVGDLIMTFDYMDGLGVAVGALLLVFGALLALVGGWVRRAAAAPPR